MNNANINQVGLYKQTKRKSMVYKLINYFSLINIEKKIFLFI